MKSAGPFFALALLGAAAACSRVERAGEGGGAALQRNLLRARAVEIVAEAGPVQVACLKAAERIARTRGCTCSVLGPADRGDAHAARIVVLPPNEPFAATLLGSLGVQAGARGPRTYFAFRRAIYAGPADALAAVFEDPDRPGLPLTLVCANDAPALERCAAVIEPGWKPWIRFYRAGALSLEGPLAVNGAASEASFVDAEGARSREMAGYEESPSRGESIHVRSAKDVDPALRDAYVEAVGRARSETSRWAGAPTPSRPLELVLHAHPEILAICATGASLSSWNSVKNEVHALLARGVPHDAGLAAARALAEDSLGAPAEAWLADGSAVHGAGRWWGRDLEEWIAWLRIGGLAPSVASLVDSQAAETNSIHAILPLRGGLFRYLLENRGEARMRELWKGTAKLAADAEIEKAFAAWLDEIAARHRAALEARRPARRAALFSGAFLAGVGIEEPGRSARRGMGSVGYEQSLLEARAIGANAALLSCFVPVEREPAAVPDLLPSPLGGRRLLGPLDGDLRVFAGLCQARAGGLRTILAPHLVTAPGGTLAGTGPQGNEAGWQRFFDGYVRFTVHFGLLAELAGADALSLGGGMTESTSGDPDAWAAGARVTSWKRDGWPKVIRAARGAFPGALTWAADSTVEAKGLLFWDDLDAVACDLEHELDERRIGLATRPDEEMGIRISAQLSELASLARAHGKPFLLTQAGFRSGTARPGEPRDPAFENDPGMQALQLDVLAKELHAARDPDAPRGVILWRWSSDPADEGVNGRDQLLRRGPAREAAARVFAGW